MEGPALLQRLSLLTLAAACPVLLTLLLFGAHQGGVWVFKAAALLVLPVLVALAAGRRVGGVAAVLAVVLLAAHRGGEWAFAAVVMLVPPALIVLAAGRRARGAAVALAALLLGGAVWMLGLDGTDRWIGGVPGSAWGMLLLLWALPLILTVWAYAASFRERESGRPEAAEEEAGDG